MLTKEQWDKLLAEANCISRVELTCDESSSVKSEPDRAQRLDAIRRHTDRFNELAKAYDRLRILAEKDGSTDVFLALVDAAGTLTTCGLDQLGRLLEAWQSLEIAQEKDDG